MIAREYIINDDDKLKATEFYPINKEWIDQLDSDLFWVIHQVLESRSIPEFGQRDSYLADIKVDNRYTACVKYFDAVNNMVRVSNWRQLIGKYVGAEYGLTPNWENDIVKFHDSNGITHEFYRLSTTFEVTDMIFGFFGYNMYGFNYEPWLADNVEYFIWNFQCIVNFP